jgi:hypothetical protein
MSIMRGYVHTGGTPRVDAQSAAAIEVPGAAVDNDTIAGERYRLTSVLAVSAPEGCAGDNWFVYRIMQGTNGITGYRRGDLERVSEDVQTIVTALNLRRESAPKKQKGARRAAVPINTGAAK